MTGGYGKAISHVVVALKTAKGTKQLKLDPSIYDALLKEKVGWRGGKREEEGGRWGRGRRLGRGWSYGWMEGGGRKRWVRGMATEKRGGLKCT